MNHGFCRTPGCEGEVRYPTLKLCAACYQYLWTWQKKPQAEQIARLHKLHLYESRMDAILPSKVTNKKFRRVTTPWEQLPGQVKVEKKRKTKAAKRLAA